jgi:hypothetical protein
MPLAIGKPVLIFAICIPLDDKVDAIIRHAPQPARALPPYLLVVFHSARIDIARFEADAFLGDPG